MGIPTEDIWKRVDESLQKTGMAAYRHHSPNKLSGGQKQRVAIAGVMAMRPRCIVLDEPTAMLDPNGRKEVLEAISQVEFNRYPDPEAKELCQCFGEFFSGGFQASYCRKWFG